MGQYTPEEIRAFKLKDILNCRMSALKAASVIYDGTGCDLGHPVDIILSDADKYYEWLRQGQDDVGSITNTTLTLSNTPGATLGQLPEPTLAQKKVLGAIAGMLGKAQADIQLKTDVLRWAEETYKQRSYPTKQDSISIFLKWYKTNN